MRGLNVRSLLIATAMGVTCGPLAGLAAPSPPGEEQEQKVVTTATSLQDKEVYKVVETIRDKAVTVVLQADKDGKLIEVRVRPVDVTKNEYVISADSISISDVAGKKMGNLVLTAEGNVAFAVTVDEKAPSVRIGVVTEAVSKALTGHLKIRPDQALIVTGVMQGLPAAKAGLKVHDVITRVDGEKVITHLKLKEFLSKCKPGQVIVLRVVREGEPKVVKVRVEAVEPKDYSVTTTNQTWWDNSTNLKGIYGSTNLKGIYGVVQPQVGTVVTQPQPQQYLTLDELQRTPTFVAIDPKISTQVLEAQPLIDAYGQPLLTYNLALANLYNQLKLTKAAEGESLEARLLAELAALEQQLAKLKALIIELEATSSNEDE